MFILLDIDGVMLKAAPWKKVESLEDGFFAFEPQAITNLQRIISETDASIILTSSHKSKFTPQQWKEIFVSRGINIENINCLGENKENLSRRDEILRWFSTGVHDSFVIIDDDKGLNALPSYLKNKCVITGSLSGLTQESANNAIEILQQNLVIA